MLCAPSTQKQMAVSDNLLIHISNCGFSPLHDPLFTQVLMTNREFVIA